MKILITGGCGFIGANAVLKFHRNHEVAVIDNLSRKSSLNNLDFVKEIAKFYHGDVSFPDDIGKAVDEFRPDVILHFAAQVILLMVLSQTERTVLLVSTLLFQIH